MKNTIILLIMPLILWAAVSFTGKVTAITDGDTIKVMKNGVETKIRLYGVDCPEKKQAYGTVAKQFTSDFCFGKTVTVVEKSIDRYGRTIGEVFVDGKSLNRALVAEGMAWWYVQLWKEKAPMAPWEFRRGN